MNESSIYNGLNVAEVSQLSLAYQADPEAFTETVRFYGKYIDRFDDMRVLLSDFKNAEELHDKKYQSYRRFHEWANSPDEIMEIALRAAGIEVLGSKNALVAKGEELRESGEVISTSMAAHFAKRIPDRNGVQINGVAYEFWEGLTTYRKREEIGWRITIFGSTGKLVHYARQNGFKQPDKNSRFGRLASPDDWQELIDNLETAAKF